VTGRSSLVAGAALLVAVGCGPSPHDGPAAVELDLGGDAAIEHGPQGGIHLALKGRCRGLGDPITMDYGLRDPDTGESLSYLGLHDVLHVDSSALADWDTFDGLRDRFRDDDAKLFVGRRVIVWVRASGAGQSAAFEESVTVR
jgi:hypothetical protein